MKRIVFSILAVAALCFFGTCRHDNPSPATLILNFGSPPGGARVFAPVDAAVSSIEISGLGPGGARVAASTSGIAPVELELVPGSWVITAKGLSLKGILLVSGSLELDLGPSQLLRRDIILNPVAGLGSISLSWTLEASLAGSLTVEGALSSPGAATVPISAPFSSPGSETAGGALHIEALQSGGWKMELRLLADGAALCGLADAVLVASGMDTKINVSFKPPNASMALGFVLPDYSALAFQLEPGQRRVAAGSSLLFRAPAPGDFSWYAEGSALGTGRELCFKPGLLPAGAPREFRIDCILTQVTLPRSGTAAALVYPAQSLGPLVWGELLTKAEGSAAAQAAMKGLGDCRDLAWSADSSRIAAAGKESNALSLIECPGPGSAFALSCLDAKTESGLLSPSILRLLPGSPGSGPALLALSEAAGAAYTLAAGTGDRADWSSLSLVGSLVDPCLAGAKDAALPPEGGCAYVAASGADAVSLLCLDRSGATLSARKAAAKGDPGLGTFSRPSCLALNAQGSLLAVGSSGDDAIYFFSRDGATGSLSLVSRLDKSSFPPNAPLSDPCALAFSPDGTSLFVLSYYGKAMIRLELNAASGLFSPSVWSKSGQSGVSGFAYPKRMALSPDGRLVLVIGSGAEDGLAMFDVSQASSLRYVGTMLASEGRALPKKPSALAFSPDGRLVAIASDGYLSIFEL